MQKCSIMDTLCISRRPPTPGPPEELGRGEAEDAVRPAAPGQTDGAGTGRRPRVRQVRAALYCSSLYMITVQAGDGGSGERHHQSAGEQYQERTGAAAVFIGGTICCFQHMNKLQNNSLLLR